MNPLISPSSDVLAHTMKTSAMGELVILQRRREGGRNGGKGREKRRAIGGGTVRGIQIAIANLYLSSSHYFSVLPPLSFHLNSSPSSTHLPLRSPTPLSPCLGSIQCVCPGVRVVCGLGFHGARITAMVGLSQTKASNQITSCCG